MKLFSNTRAKRNTALMVLLVWLFTLASGIAHACMLEEQGTHGHAAAASASNVGRAPAISAGHASIVANHDGNALKASCLKACDDSSQSLPTPQTSFDQAGLGPAMSVSVVWIAPTPLSAAMSGSGDPYRSQPELPIRVRYSRLAL